VVGDLRLAGPDFRLHRAIVSLARSFIRIRFGVSMLIRRPHLAAVRTVAALAFATTLACHDSPTPPRPVAETEVAISATLTAEQQAVIAAMSVEVTGPGITTPIVVTLNVSGATVNGTVRVPVGTARVFTVRAFNAQGQEVGAGSSTSDVVVGTNPTVTVALNVATQTGDVPIDVTIGSYTVAVSPSPVTIARGATTTLTATVSAIGGGAVSAPDVQWGARNPVIAGVTAGANGTATLTGGVAGTTTVVASWRGIATAVTVTVTP
jgi:hypothetical protein